MIRKLLLLILLSLIPLAAYGQGMRVDNPAGPATKNVQNFLSPLPGASIAICTSAGTGTPCTPLVPTSPVTLCTDATCSTAAPNPFLADSNGNWGGWLLPGTYKVSITAPGATGQLITVTVPITPSGNITFTGSDTFSQQIISTVTVGTAPFSIASPTIVPNLNVQFHGGFAAPSSAFVGVSDTQPLTNKTIDCTLNTLAKNPCVVYSTVSAATNASITATTMATAGGSGNTYRFSAYSDVTVVGTSCAANSSAAIQIIYTDPNISSTSQATYLTMTIVNNGTVGSTNSVLNNSVNPAMTFRAKASTAVQYQVTFTPGASCAPAPTYQVYPVLEQIQ